jgi:hypothetical protein
MIEDSLRNIVNNHHDPYVISKFIEPYLSMIKSRELYAFYYMLRYQTGKYDIESIIEESKSDYRLEKLLKKLVLHFEK